MILHRELQAEKRSITASARNSSPAPPPYTPYEDFEAASEYHGDILMRCQHSNLPLLDLPSTTSSLPSRSTQFALCENSLPRRAPSNPEFSPAYNHSASNGISRPNSSLLPAFCGPPLPSGPAFINEMSPVPTQTFLEPLYCTYPPFIVQSLGVDLSDGFPYVELASDLYRHSEIKHEDWERFIDHANARIEDSVNEDPSGYTEDARAYVAQWSAAFFEPRGLKVTLRPGVREYLSPDDNDLVDVEPLVNTSSGLTYPSSPSLSPHISFDNLRVPSDLVPVTWTSLKAAAAHIATCKIEKKLERARRKHERRTQAAQKKVEKVTRRIEKKQRKAMEKRAQQEAKAARKEYKKNKKAVNTNAASNTEYVAKVWTEIDKECWELVVEYL